MPVNITKPRQTSIPSNIEPEAKPVVVAMSWGGEARRQKGRLRGRRVGRDLMGVVQRNENEEEILDIQKMEGYDSSKSETLIKMETAIETIERTVEDLCRDHKKGQNWISMR
jgi:hypothetical protein